LFFCARCRDIFNLKKHFFHASIFNNMGRVESYMISSDRVIC